MKAVLGVIAWTLLCWGVWLAVFALTCLCDERKK